MTTLRLPPDEFRLLRRILAALKDTSPADAARLLTADELRQFFAEHTTVVRPGETLIIRTDDLTPHQMREYQQNLQAADFGFMVVLVHGAELAVQSPATPGWLEDAYREARSLMDTGPGVPPGERPEPRRYQYPVGGLDNLTDDEVQALRALAGHEGGDAP